MPTQLPRVHPDAAGADVQAVLAFVSRWQEVGEPHSLMIVKAGAVVFEHWWDPYAPLIPHAMYSFSKSVTSTAIGFAFQEGLLRLDERLVDVFADLVPAEPSPNLQSATLESLLTMSCGHSSEPGWEGDWMCEFLTHPFDHQPGHHFCYNTIGTNLLCVALRRRSGQELVDYLTPRLFEPLDITSVGCWTMPDGTHVGGVGLSLTTEDMAKLGLFFLQSGQWHGRRLLNAAWFERATSTHIETSGSPFADGATDCALGYGYQFWRCQPDGVYRAFGMWGQFAIMDPNADAVIVMTQRTPEVQPVLDAAWEILLPALTSPVATNTNALPAARSSVQPLNNFAEDAIRNVPVGEFSFPVGADFITTFNLHAIDVEAPVPILGIGFRFTDSSTWLDITLEAGRGSCQLTPHLTAFAVAGRAYAAAAGTVDDVFTLELRCLEVGIAGSSNQLRGSGDTLVLESVQDFGLGGARTSTLLQREGSRTGK